MHDFHSDLALWACVLHHVSSGRSGWFEVAEQLKAVSDAHVSEEHNFAAGEALGTNPDLILARATGPFFLSEVCQAPDVDDARFNSVESAFAELSRRITAVRRVTNPGLARVRDDCVSSLMESEQGLRQFFEPIR